MTKVLNLIANILFPILALANAPAATGGGGITIVLNSHVFELYIVYDA